MNGFLEMAEVEKCRVCLEKKLSLMSLYDMVLERYLPAVIEYVCGVQILEEPEYNICINCAMELIQAENIIKKFRKSQEKELNLTISDDHPELEEELAELIDSLDDSRSDAGEGVRNNNEEIEKEEEEEEEGADEKESHEDNNTKPKRRRLVLTVNKKKDFHFVCELCPFETDFAKYFRDHMMNIHQIEKPRIFKCSHCPESYVEHRSLQQHVAHVHEHKPRRTKYLCSECGKGFGKNSHLVRHSYVHQPESRPFKCEVCPLRFVNMSNTKRHMVASHSDFKPHSCKICGSSFGVIYGLRAHMKRVHCENKYHCPQCGSSFKMKKELESHLQHECN